MRKFITILALALFLASPSAAVWGVNKEVDPFTDAKKCYAHSDRVRHDRVLNPPYNGTKAWLGVGSDATSSWAYIGFTFMNIPESGEIWLRYRTDKEVGYLAVSEASGGRGFLKFSNDDNVIGIIRSANFMLIEVPFYGSHPAIFRFDLSGSSASISKCYDYTGYSVIFARILEERREAERRLREKEMAELEEKREAERKEREAERARREAELDLWEKEMIELEEELAAEKNKREIEQIRKFSLSAVKKVAETQTALERNTVSGCGVYVKNTDEIYTMFVKFLQDSNFSHIDESCSELQPGTYSPANSRLMTYKERLEVDQLAGWTNYPEHGECRSRVVENLEFLLATCNWSELKGASQP